MGRREKRNKKKKARRRIFLLLPLLLLLSWAVYEVSQVGYKKLETTFPVLTTYRDSLGGKAFTVLKETLVKAGDDGIVIFNAQEGEKIPVGFEIATLNLRKDISRLKDRLIKVQAALDYKNNVTEPSEKNYEITEGERTILENIQEFVKEKDLNALVGAVNSLDLNTKHTVNISELSELLDLSIEELETEKKELSEKISTNHLVYKAEYSGVVSYYLPTGDTDLSFEENLGKFSYDALKNLTVQQTYDERVTVKRGEPLYRLIDNLDWYVAVVLHNSEGLPEYTLGREVTVSLDGKEPLRGKIFKINQKDENSCVLLIRMEEGFRENYMSLSHKGEVILREKEGFLVPASSLVEKKQQMGVYVQDLHGLVKFVPVAVLEERGDYVFVERGDQENKIKTKDSEFTTLSLTDAVVLHPEKVEEKQLLQ